MVWGGNVLQFMKELNLVIVPLWSIDYSDLPFCPISPHGNRRGDRICGQVYVRQIEEIFIDGKKDATSSLRRQ